MTINSSDKDVDYVKYIFTRHFDTSPRKIYSHL